MGQDWAGLSRRTGTMAGSQDFCKITQEGEDSTQQGRERADRAVLFIITPVHIA